jgi:hypothetical protein
VSADGGCGEFTPTTKSTTTASTNAATRP